MTYEEFKSRAMNKIHQGEGGLIVLKEYRRVKGESWHNLSNVGVYEQSTIYLHTMEEAEEHIKQHVMCILRVLTCLHHL